MVDRFLMWLGAGVVTAGMSAAMLAGAGAAIADDGSSSDSGGTSTSESSNSADSTKDSPGSDGTGTRSSGSGATGTRTSAGAPRTRVGATTPADTRDTRKNPGQADAAGQRGDDKKPGGAPKENDTSANGDDEDADVATDHSATDDVTTDDSATGDLATDDPATDDQATDDQATDGQAINDPATDEVGRKSRADGDRTTAQQTAAITRNAAITPSNEDTAARVEPENKAVTDTEIANGPVQVAAEERTTIALEKAVEDDTEQFTVQAVTFASAPLAATTATAPQIPNILRVIGTIVFDLYGVAVRLFGGPPILPPNSTVTVRSSTLRIDCGCEVGEGKEVAADWYIPKTADDAPPPDRLVYLQHGFLAAAPWYSHTAAALAERTNSIVVAPSITSNFFAADACWLGGAPMHEAMAGLFDDENTALADSALAAGYSGPIPDRVVLMGHSLGGGAVSGMAGHMADDERIDRLAGVVLLDGVALGDPARMTESLVKVPLDIPIYQLAAPVYMWNNFGSGLDALVAARPGEFVGVTLVNGSHVDAMRGGNPLIQFAQELVAGFSRPENASAAQMLMVGWVNDMFAGNEDTGVYLELGEQFSFDTPAGTATVVALPNTLTRPFLLNFLRPFMSLANGFFSFDPVCVRQSVGSSGAGQCSGSIAA